MPIAPTRRVACALVLGTLVLPSTAAATAAAAAPQFKDLLDKARQAAQHAPAGSTLPASDVAAGLKEAVARGTTQAITQLGRDGGFWNNPAVRIPLPGALEQAGKLARQLGQGERVDAFEHSLKRAAEQAVPEVADIFGDAIRRMTLDDARGILAGGDHAATDFFRRTAGQALAARIRPIVAHATDSVGVTQKYKALMAGQGGGALGGALGSLGALSGGHGKSQGGGAMDLDQYVTDQALDGLFATIADQEQRIRRDPAARTTDLLKKVFGGH